MGPYRGIKVVRTDRELECPRIDQALRDAGVDLILLPDGVSVDDLCGAATDADLILMCYTPITARVIAAASKLKGIVKYGVGIDAIDIDAAKSRSIPVVNVPEYAEETVAEGAFALLIALAKKLPQLGQAMQADGWVWPSAPWLATDIAGKTLGLVGVGRIGRSMARMAGQGFRARVLGYDPFVSAEAMQTSHVEKFDNLHDMLGRCDFISIHCVLNAETRHLIGAAELAAMKSSAILVNVSRGAIVDELALLATLKAGQLGGAGLDVYSREPVTKTGHPLSALYGMANVILTPHLTFFTHGAMQRLEADTIARCAEILDGRAVTIRSTDPRLTSQRSGVCIVDPANT